MSYLKGFVLLIAIATVLAQDCESPTYTFRTHFNSDSKLELGMEEGTEVARFDVTNTRSAKTYNEYMEVAVDNDQLVFTVKKKFEEYEKLEHGLTFVMVIEFRCSSGTIGGTYYQSVLEVNKYTPEFSLEVYEATVPLPLPKNFDLSPFLDNSMGITAIDYDLSKNTVEFKLSQNDYLMVESFPVDGSNKQFKAVLRLKEQILKLPGDLELELKAVDQGDPPKTGRARVVIKPDLTIEYNDPPQFKQTFFKEDYIPESGNSFVVELVPGTVHEDIQYELVGDDAGYFGLSVEPDKKSATVSLEAQSQPAPGKYFLSVVVQAKRSALQTAECVIVVDLKESHEGESATTIEKVLSTLHLEEGRTHEEVYPVRIGDCSYEILSQMPNKSEGIFSVDQSTGWITSFMLDREDDDLFSDVEDPHFHVVLQLRCPNDPPGTAENYDLSIDDIFYSTVITHLRILVDDVNDNAPTFQYPTKNGVVFAFPVSGIPERLMINSFLQVIATDLDAGLNAEIRFRLEDSNGNFDVHPKSGIIYPKQNYILDDDPQKLTIYATDRDGADDGNTSLMEILVIPALMYQIMVLQPDNVTKESLDEFVRMLEMKSGFRLFIFEDSVVQFNESYSSHVTLRIPAVAFSQSGELISTSDFIDTLPELTKSFIKPLSEIQQCDLYPEEPCSVYPYVVVMSVFIVLFVASLALVAYFYFKLRQYTKPGDAIQNEPSIQSSEEILVDNPVLGTFSTPPAEKKEISGATVDYSSDSITRSKRLVRNLSSLLIIDEGEETSKTDSLPEEPSLSPQRKKSIRFNEEVERIETF